MNFLIIVYHQNDSAVKLCLERGFSRIERKLTQMYKYDIKI